MNLYIATGRLVKNPEITSTNTPNGKLKLARFTMAIDRRYKQEGGQTADFIQFKAFGKTAEFIEKYCEKGSKYLVEARIQTGSYLKDDQTIYTTDFIVENIEFCESKRNRSESDAAVSEDGFMNVPDGIDEELPFN